MSQAHSVGLTAALMLRDAPTRASTVPELWGQPQAQPFAAENCPAVGLCQAMLCPWPAPAINPQLGGITKIYKRRQLHQHHPACGQTCQQTHFIQSCPALKKTPNPLGSTIRTCSLAGMLKGHFQFYCTSAISS